MTDTQLILAEMKALSEKIDELSARIPKRAKPKRKTNPTRQEVIDYAAERQRSDLANRFYDYYTAPFDDCDKWLNGKGNPIYSFKATFLTWCSKNPDPNAVNPNNRSIWDE